MAPPTPPGHSFTVRGVVAGLAVGTVICAANVYFGLQTGWVCESTNQTESTLLIAAEQL